MKGYKESRKITEGICFICGKPCDSNSYCHHECAIAFAEEKDRRIKEARQEEKNET